VNQNSVGEDGVIPMPLKGFWNTVVACILLTKNLQDGVPAITITKIPLAFDNKVKNVVSREGQTALSLNIVYVVFVNIT
jgi:hypothetical protein